MLKHRLRAQVTNAIERLHEEFKRRIKTRVKSEKCWII
jgi:hypothetical protein